MHPDIIRLSGSATGRSRAVVHGGFAWTVATARTKSLDLAGQTTETLAQIEANLLDCGTDKTRLLTATVYLTDISHKAEMDGVWNTWVADGCWPQRACVQAALAPGDLVEIVAMAAMPSR